MHFKFPHLGRKALQHTGWSRESQLTLEGKKSSSSWQHKQKQKIQQCLSLNNVEILNLAINPTSSSFPVSHFFFPKFPNHISIFPTGQGWMKETVVLWKNSIGDKTLPANWILRMDGLSWKVLSSIPWLSSTFWLESEVIRSCIILNKGVFPWNQGQLMTSEFKHVHTHSDIKKSIISDLLWWSSSQNQWFLNLHQ